MPTKDVAKDRSRVHAVYESDVNEGLVITSRDSACIVLKLTTWGVSES